MVDTALVFGLLAFVFYQVSNLTSKEIKEIYARNPSFIPDWIFGIVWTVLYVGIFFAGYEAFKSDAVNDYLVPMLVLYVINLFLNKFWTRTFFDDESPRMALAVIIGINATGIGVLVFMGLSNLWLSFGLFGAYALWVLVATVLNCQWVCKGDSNESDEILPTQMKAPPALSRRLQQTRRHVAPPKLPGRNGLLKNI